jgi:uncharacterized delta-60 repeat protein
MTSAAGIPSSMLAHSACAGAVTTASVPRPLRHWLPETDPGELTVMNKRHFIAPVRSWLSVVAGLLLVLGAVRSLRAQAPGTLDPTFDRNASAVEGQVNAVAVQPDGKIIVGGEFTKVGGQPRANLARLQPDGTVESLATFKIGSGVNGPVSCIAIQSDGKIIIGGLFSVIDGQPHRCIARLRADGTAETAAEFNMGNGPSPAGPDTAVTCLAIQPDEKILIGGRFDQVNGQPRSGIARLEPDGTMESTATFDTGSGVGPVNLYDRVYSLALQPDGRILIGGGFESVNNQLHRFLARLNSDGTVQGLASFNPGNDLAMYGALVQPDARILIGGYFLYVNQNPEGPLVRLLPDGSVADPGSFTANLSIYGRVVQAIACQADGKILAIWAGNSVKVLRLQANGIVEVEASIVGPRSPGIPPMICQADGKILIAGSYETVDGQFHNGIARLLNGPAPQSVSVTSRQRVEWMRSGAAPEVEQVTFELSDGSGDSWTPLGPGVRVAGGWECTGLTLPATGTIRARGRSLSGNRGSSGLYETIAPFSRITPEISIQHPPGVELVSGSGVVDFGPVVVESEMSRTFTIRNAWTGELSGITISKSPDGNPADFSISPPNASTLAPDASMSFTVSVRPSASGTRSGVLQVASNDEDENPFSIALTATGTEPTPLQAWRSLHFGTPYDTGAGADLNDPDGDCLANLIEFATGSNPLAVSPPIGELVRNGNNLEFTYTRRKAALSELTFVREFSDTLSGNWSRFGSSVETILSDDGLTQQVKVNTPAGTGGRRFVRLRVTRL